MEYLQYLVSLTALKKFLKVLNLIINGIPSIHLDKVCKRKEELGF